MAIVGAGNIADGCHMPAVQAQNGEASVVAVVDVDRERAKAFAGQWDTPAVHDDLRQMLQEERPDLVIVCTPPVAHREAVVACLDAGAWMWCEKPPTLSVIEYDAVSAHEREGGPYASYVFQHRFGSAARALREQIRTGSLGAPLVGVCHTLWYRDDAYFDVPWRGKWETEGGGPTMGHGIHQMDLMLALMGEWTEVRAAMGTLARDVETEDVSMAMVRFAGGAMVSMVNSLLSPARPATCVSTSPRPRSNCPTSTATTTPTGRGPPHPTGPRQRPPSWGHRSTTRPVRTPRSCACSCARCTLESAPRPVATTAAASWPSSQPCTSRRRPDAPSPPDMITPGTPFYHSMSGRLDVAQDNADKEKTGV
ncbi:Gfo/Idh/MocA family oxidoreductase [Streptomyces sp. TG1A-60]|uniref:Gfo/Idh/MocA family protein n=1 Tax=Streptomyces sp. TG1A-60 TaxID=3129111 RepID=UPI0030D2B4C5